VIAPVAHLVGEMLDGLQVCRRCGFVVLDGRGATVSHPGVVLRGYAPGVVTVFSGGSAAGRAADAIDCTNLGRPN
jgi:hypothetical protein